MELVRNLPQQYRQDPWVLALADAILGVLEDQSRRSLEIRAQDVYKRQKPAPVRSR